MPRKKVRLSPVDKRTEEVEDDDFFFDDSQSSSGKAVLYIHIYTHFVYGVLLRHLGRLCSIIFS